MNPLRITLKDTCKLLSVSRESLYNLMKNDSTFPKPQKTGSSRQSAVYFDYAEVESWYKQQKETA